jgi:ribosomal protein S6
VESYDALIAFDLKAGEEKIGDLLKKYQDKLKSSGAEIEGVEKWGRKELPFKMKKHKSVKEGYFAVLTFKGQKSLPKLLVDALRLNEEVVRFTVTKKPPKRLLEIEGAPLEEKTEIAPAMLEEHGQS